MSINAKRAVPTRNRLLSSCAIAAIATLAWQAPAWAQLTDGGFQGVGVAVGGKATISIPDAMSTLVTINAPRAIIDWQPNSGVDFLPQGRTGTFVNSAASELADFTVLNRISSDQPVALNGNVISRLQDAAQNMSRGGRVWFSAPGGIIVGANSTFDVGSLLLATGNARTSGTGAEEDFDALSTRFRNAADSQAKIDIKPGAQINASSDGRAPTFANPSSYVALIAPRIRQGGTVNVDGSAGYAAGEDVEMRIFNGGLFGFTVFSGSSIGRTEANPDGDRVTFIHDGTTTGPGATAEFEADPQEMFIIAVPKNDAVTMLLQGTIGYAPAAAAFQREDRIILAAAQGTVDGVNNDVTADLVMTGLTATSDINSGASGDLRITGGSFEQLLTGATNATVLGGNYSGFVEIFARDTARVTATGENPLNASDQFHVVGGRSATFEAVDGGRATLGDFLLVDARNRSEESLGVGGTATVSANNGIIQVAGSISVAADGRGFTSEGSDGTGRGGAARVEAIRGETGYGSISAGGGLQASANGFGAEGSSGFGGAVVIEAQGGSIAAPSISAFADGIGGFSFESGYGGVSLPFGDGQGGSVTMTTSDAFPNQELSRGTIDTASLIELYARGLGGRTNSCEGFCERVSVAQLGELTNTGTGGAGVGGMVTLQVSSGLVDANSLVVDVRGAGGAGSSDSDRLNGDGSPGEGGTAKLIFDGGRGAFEVIDVNASGTGGQAGRDGAGGRGGDAQGGTIELSTSNGGAIRAEPQGESFTPLTQITLLADAVAGDGEDGFEDGYGGMNAGGGFGGNAQGGGITIDFNGGTSFIGRLGADVEGDGGEGGDGLAEGFDEDDPEQTNPLGARDGGDSGFGRGGTIDLRIDGGNLAAGLFLDAEGESDDGGDSAFRNGGRGGDARAGIVTVGAIRSGSITGDITIEVNSQAGDGGDANGERGGDGGNAEKGAMSLLAEDGGQIIIGSETSQFFANAEGGNGGGVIDDEVSNVAGGRGGSAEASSVTLQASGNDGEEASRITLDFPRFNAEANGGQGGDGRGRGGDGGQATGGTFNVIAENGGQIVARQFDLDASGESGDGGDSDLSTGGLGADSRAGTVTLRASGGGGISGNLFADVNSVAGDGGFGASGGDGGNARKGALNLLADELGSIVLNQGESFFNAQGEGGFGGGTRGGDGDGGDGGDAEASSIFIRASGGNAEQRSQIDLGSVFMRGETEGGDAIDVRGAGGDGGNALGGTFTIAAEDGGHITASSIRYRGDGFAGFGADSEGGAGAGGTGGSGKGGDVRLRFTDGGSADIDDLDIELTGSGGDGGDVFERNDNVAGSPGGDGGDGRGGSFAMTISLGSTVNLGQADILATGEGGSGGFGNTGNNGGAGGDGGDGGDGYGGAIALTVDGGALTMFGGEGGFDFESEGIGGQGGRGGEAEFRLNTYRFVEAGLTWEEALAAAALQELNGVPGHLVTITSFAENFRVAGAISSAEGSSAWAAASDEGEGNENNFTWRAGPENGRAVPFAPKTFPWARAGGGPTEGAEPIGGTSENFLEVGSDGSWNDLDSVSTRDYVVEFETALAAGSGGRGGDGGFAKGGDVAIRVTDGGTANIDSIGIEADASGGNGNLGGLGGAVPEPLPPVGETRAASGSGGEAQGGSALIEAADGGTLNVREDGYGSFFSGIEVDVDAQGGFGGGLFGGEGGFFEDISSLGGKGTGGAATLRAAGGTIDVEGNVDFTANASAGAGSLLGGDAQGGTAAVEAANGGVVDVGGSINLFAVGGAFQGESFSVSGIGGAGIGGTTRIAAIEGALIAIGGSVLLDASGVGGAGFFEGGDGFGGTASILASGSDIEIGGGLDLNAKSSGGFSFFAGGFGDGGGNDIALNGVARIEILSPDGRVGRLSLDTGEGFSSIRLSTVGTGAGFNGSCFPFCGGLAAAKDGEANGGFAAAAAVPGGGGGDGFGGTAEAIVDGILEVRGLTLDVQGYGGRAGSASAGLPGGDGQGGIATVDFGGNENSLERLEIYANGFGGEGGSAFDNNGIVNGTPGGGGFGGTASLLAGGGAVTIDQVDIDANGQGGRGGRGGLFDSGYGEGGGQRLVGSGGRGGVGMGGTARVDAGFGGIITLPAIALEARGRGGEGGQGGNDFNNGNGGDGGIGGEGTGGTAELATSGGTLDVRTVVEQVFDDGYGTISTSTFVSGPTLDAAGFGGEGGRGGSGAGLGFVAGSGGAGGIATGGTARIAAFAGTLDTGPALLSARGFGGEGGQGGYGNNDANGGQGGRGGTGAGGLSELHTSGGSLTVFGEDIFDDGYGSTTFVANGATLASDGFGGDGGDGGNSGNGGGAGSGGSGGDGGDGLGGRALVDVFGGSLLTGPADFQASGFGGEGGFAGSVFNNEAFAAAAVSTDGAAGSGVGGIAEIRIADGFQPGSAELGETFMQVSGISGDFGSVPGSETSGTAQINVSAAADGALTIADLNVESFGRNDAGHRGFALTASGGAIEVAGRVDVVVDQDASFTGLGAGRLVAEDDVAVGANGSILLAQDNQELFLIAGNDVELEAGNSILGETGSLRAEFDIDLIAGDFVEVGRLDADFNIDADAGRDVSVGSGRAGFNINLEAGNSVFAGSLDAGFNIDAEAGSDISIASIVAGFNVGADAGRDVLITDITAGFNIDIEAGLSVVSTGTFDGSRIDVFAGLDASLANARARSDIDIFAGRSLRLDNGTGRTINLTAGNSQIDSAGLLTATQLNAVAGTNIALTDVDVVLSLLLTTPNGLVSGRDFTSAGDITIDARDGITLASGLAGDDLVGTSSGGSIAIGSARVVGQGLDSEAEEGPDELRGNVILLDAANDVRLDSGALADGTAATRIGLTARSGRIDSGGLLRATRLDASAGTNIALTDVIVADSLILAAANGFVTGRNFRSDGDIMVDAAGFIGLASGTAGGDIRLDSDAGTIRAPDGSDLVLNAAGTVTAIGNLVSDIDVEVNADDDITLTGANAGRDFIANTRNGAFAVGTLDAGQDIVATATLGALAITTGRAGRDLTLRAGDDIGVGFAQAGDDIRTRNDGGDFAATTLRTTGLGPDSERPGTNGVGSNIIVSVAAGNIALIDANSASSLNLQASGRISSTGTLGAVSDAKLNSGLGIVVNTVTSTGGDGVSLNGGDGSIEASLVDASVGVNASADGDIAIARAQAGFDIFAIAGRSIRLDNGSAGNKILLDARGGGISSNGLLTTFLLDATAAADIALNDVTVVENLILAAANGFVTGRNFRSDGDIMVDAEGLIGLASGTAGGNILLDSALGIINAPAGSGLRLDAGGSVTAIGSIGADLDLDINAGDSITIGDAEVGRDIDLDAIVSVLAGNLSAGSAVDIDTRQDTNVNSIAAGSNVELAARGSINVGTIDAGSNIDADAGGDIGITAAVSGALIDFNASGSVTSDGLLDAGTTLDVFAGSDITINMARARDDIDLFAVDAVTIANGTAGRDFLIDAGGQIRVTGVAQAGDDFIANSFEGSFAGATVRTTGLGEDVDESGYGTGDGSNIFVDAAGAIRLDNGRAADLIDLNAMGGAIDSAGLLAATQLNASASTNIALTDVDVINSLILTTPNGLVSGRNFLSGGDITIDARDGITLASGTAGRDLTLRTDRDIEIGFGQAGDDFDARSELGSFRGGTVRSTGLGPDSDAAGTSRAGSNIFVRAVTGLSLADGSSAFDMDLNADRVSSSGTLAAASAVRINSRLDTSVNRVTAGDTIGLNGQIGTIGAIRLDAGNSVSAGADGNVSIATARADNDIIVNTNNGGSIRLDNGNAGNRIFLNARGGGISSGGLLTANRLDATTTASMALNDVDVVNSLVLATPAGMISGRNFGSDGNINLNARDGITLASANAGGWIDADSSANIAIQSASAVDDIDVVASGSVALGSADAGDLLLIDAGSNVSATALTAVEAIEIDAGGGVTLGSAATDDFIAINALAAISATNLRAGDTITLDAGGNILVATARADNDFLATSAGGRVVGGTIVVSGLAGGDDGSNIVIQASGDATLDNGDAAGAIRLTSLDGSATSGGLLRATDLFVSAADDIALNDLAIVNDIALTAASGSISGSGAFQSRGSITLDSFGDIDVDSIDAGQFVSVRSDGAALLGTVNAEASDVRVLAQRIALGSATAGRDILLDSPGAIGVGSATAGDDFIATSSGGGVTAGTVRITMPGRSDDLANPFPFSSNIVIDAAQDIVLENGIAPAAEEIRLTARNGSVNAGTLDARSIVTIRAADDVAVGTASAMFRIDLDAIGGSITASTLNSGTNLDATAAKNVTIDNATAGTIIFDALGGSIISTGILDAVNSIDARAGADVVLNEVRAGSQINLRAVDALTLARGEAGNRLILSAGGNVDAGTLLSRSADITVEGADILADAATARRTIRLTATGDIALGAAEAGDDVLATVGGDFAADSVLATGEGVFGGEGGSGDGSNIFIDSVGDIAINTGTAINHIGLFSESGSIASSTALTAGDEIEVGAGNGITLADATATDGEIDLEAGQSVVAGALRSGISTTIESRDGGVTVASVAATTAGVVTGEVEGFSAIAGGGDLSVGTVSADNIGLAARGGITAGTLAAEDLVLLFADGAINLGTVATDGLFHIGSTATVEALEGFEDFDRAAFDALSHLPSGGTVTITGPVTAGRIDLNAGGALTFASIASTTGADLLAGGNLTGQSVTAGGDIVGRGATIDIRNAATPGQLDLAATADVLIGTADVGSLSALGSNITAEALLVDAAIRLATGAGNVTVGSAVSGGSISLSASSGNVRATTLDTSGSVLANAGGAADLGTIRADDEIAIAGSSVSLTDGIAGSDIDLSSAGAITVGFAQAGDDFVADAGTTFTATTVITSGTSADGDGESGYGELSATAVNIDGSNIIVDAGGAIALANGDAHDAMRLTSTDGAVTSATRLVAGTDLDADAATTITLVRADAGDDIDLGAGGAINAATLTAGGDVALASTGGAVAVATDLQAGGNVDASGTAVALNAVGPLSVRTASASAGNVGLTSGGNLNVQSAQATGNVAATSANGTLGLTGDVNGVQLAFSSRDIAVGQNARVGTTARTTGIDITANGGNVVIGGTGTSGGYRLDNAEFGRLASRDITVRNQSETAGVQLEALTVRGASANSPNLTGRLTIASGGNVEMVGRLSVETAGSANAVRVTAGNAFYADTAGAGIAIANGNALTGSIDVEARTITVASRGAVTDLAGANSIDARDDRLGRNDGADDRAGYLRAGGIRLAASQRIHVQNSGLNEDAPVPVGVVGGTVNDNRAGLTAGSGGITLVTLGQAPVEIIINGREENGTGGFVTGASLIPALTLQNGQGGAASFAAGSTVNGCLIGGTTCGFQFEPTVVVQDLLEDLLDDSEDSITRPPLLAFGQLISVEGSPLLPVIDEPVTGTGDDAIWMPTGALGPDCDEEREDCLIDQPVTGSGNEELQRGTGDETPSTTIERGPQDRTIDAPVTGTGNEDNGESE